MNSHKNPQHIGISSSPEGRRLPVVTSRQERFEGYSDIEIWRAFKQGSEQAFSFIYKHHINALFNYGCQFSRDRELVKDCIQDLFIALRKRRKKLTDVTSIKAYLFKSLRRDVIRYAKKNDKYLSFYADTLGGFDIAISQEYKFMNDQLKLERKNQLEQAFNKITVRQKEAVLLYYYEGLSYEAVAEVMNIKMVKSARKLIYRAIEALRVVLKPIS